MPGYRFAHVLLTCGALFVLIKVGMINLVELLGLVGEPGHFDRKGFSYPGMPVCAGVVLVLREGICRSFFPVGCERREPGLRQIYNLAFPVLGVLLWFVSLPRMVHLVTTGVPTSHLAVGATLVWVLDLTLCVVGLLMLAKPERFTAVAVIRSRPEDTTGWWAADAVVGSLCVALGCWHVSLGVSEVVGRDWYGVWRPAWLFFETRGYVSGLEIDRNALGVSRAVVGVVLLCVALGRRRPSRSSVPLSVSSRAFAATILFVISFVLCVRTLISYFTYDGPALVRMFVPGPALATHAGVAGLVLLLSSFALRVAGRGRGEASGVIRRRRHLAAVVGIYAGFVFVRGLVAGLQASSLIPPGTVSLVPVSMLLADLGMNLVGCLPAALLYLGRRRLADVVLIGQSDDLHDEPHALILAAVVCVGFDIILYSLPPAIMVKEVFPSSIPTRIGWVSIHGVLLGGGVMALAPFVARLATGRRG